jgi:hypothetical protein
MTDIARTSPERLEVLAILFQEHVGDGSPQPHLPHGIGDHELIPAGIAQSIQIRELLTLVSAQTVKRIAASAGLGRIDHGLELAVMSEQPLYIEHRRKADGLLAAHTRLRAVRLDVSAAHERKRSRVNIRAILQARRRAAATATSTKHV